MCVRGLWFLILRITIYDVLLLSFFIRSDFTFCSERLLLVEMLGERIRTSLV